MQDDKKLPDDLGTAHEVILVQSDTLVKLKGKNDELNKSLQEALAEIRFLRSGKKREKFINADQLLLEFPEDKELQASLEAARKEAEEAIQEVTYIRNHWEALNVFVNDGALPIDNNQVERLMKRIAVGRKNWLFIGSLRAGIRNASLMSLVASALRQDLDIAMYLESFITHMLRGTAIAGDPS